MYCSAVVIYLFVIFFFFNNTVTTEFYTYGHTLTLHDALPIFYATYATGFKASSINLSRDSRPTAEDLPAIISGGLGLPNLVSGSRFASPEESRSEEHTSELQSLMRNSYAVFCLKKTTKLLRLHNPSLLNNTIV